MPTKISHVKATKILHLYFSGMPQLKIADKCWVNQATVSRCAAGFKKEAAVKGITKAAKEHGIMEEIDGLRSIATELSKHKADVEDAMLGLTMVKLFNSLGVPKEEYKPLAKAVSKVKDPNYIKVAMGLAKLEESTGKTYTDIFKEYQQLGEEIAGRQATIATLKEKQVAEEKVLEKLELTRKEKEAELIELQEEAEQKKAAADAGVKDKLAQAGLTMEKIAKLHPIVERMNKLDISDDKLDIFVKEHQSLEEQGITWINFKTVAEALAKAGELNGGGLAAKLAEYGTLDRVISSMQAEKTLIQPEVKKLGEDRLKLTAEVDGLTKSKVQLEAEVGHLEGSKKALDGTIKTLEVRRTHLEKHLAMLENDVAKLTEEKKSLADEAGQKQLAVYEMEDKLKESDAIDRGVKEKQTALQELDAKVTAAGQKFKLFEAFLGLVGSKTAADVEKFLLSAEALINEAKAGKYSPELLLDHIVGKLAGGAFDLLACEACGAEFMIVVVSKKQVLPEVSIFNHRCPECGGIYTTIKKKLLAQTLKEELVPKTQIFLENPGKITPGEKPPGVGL